MARLVRLAWFFVFVSGLVCLTPTPYHSLLDKDARWPVC